jgi:hypothetical protein
MHEGGVGAVLGLIGVCVVALTGCGDGGPGKDFAGGICDPGPIDSTPGDSSEFEPGDIATARSAECLVVIYCDGVESDAQRVGCLSHVTESDVCRLDTEGRRLAVGAYVEATGDDSICD